jgi:membrane-bound metal-dependent hydrolase YbcI (DUF457 family)
VGRYKLKKGSLKDSHGRPSVVDIMSGPQFGFRRTSDNLINIEFLPWHRTWSHSYVLGLILALPWSVLAWFLNWNLWWLYSIIAFLGFAIHITEDLTGHMGGSLIWPFKQKRYDGLSWFRASNPHANFSVDYASFVIIIHNLWRFTPPELSEGVFLTHMPWYTYYPLFLVLPLMVYASIALICKEPSKPKDGEISAQKALNEQAQAETESDIKRAELEYEAENYC